MVEDSFYFERNGTAPLLISVPHCGTMIPDDIGDKMDRKKLEEKDDTDWFVDRVYSFARELGVNMIRAKYHRWVVDLNRDPDSQPLYNDGRLITRIVPIKDFLGEDLYLPGQSPDSSMVRYRIGKYFNPYHNFIREELDSMRRTFKRVLLFDAHSIRSVVPSISDKEFPPFILGDNDGKSSEKTLSETALAALAETGHEIRHNYLFKGGFITRHFGDPPSGVNSLQLEMSKKLYMDDSEKNIASKKVQFLSSDLKNVLETLLRKLHK